MKELDYAKLSKQGTDLFEDVRKTLENSRIESLRPYSKEVPNNFVDDNKKINVVFA